MDIKNMTNKDLLKYSLRELKDKKAILLEELCDIEKGINNVKHFLEEENQTHFMEQLVYFR